ncbi:MAG: hypothetical protein PHW69_08380 [Elusimicrobiaceae bacterium]|nr:hypothetical protein [Elusimicrobiaceae bacterium]
MKNRFLAVLAAVVLTAACVPSARRGLSSDSGQVPLREPARSPVSAGQGGSDDIARKLAVLDEILQSRNDNDPRLDTGFNEMSSDLRAALRLKYRQLPLEQRNERGTIVYLLGRNAGPADWRFFREVVSERPCLSLADCSVPQAYDDEHRAQGLAVTLEYPAMVALKQAENALSAGRDESGARAVVLAAKTSGAAVVAERAAALEQKFPAKDP